ncbi:RHS repeat-associated core domain-containing protein [Sulfitobacter porphyrae]|uniref:RHS repeat-associated core domain-containing protein n=1 Tax=Sulfitobacter porphyrae TaxID=1246864 RepID=A0ABW2B8M3_9RHOB
MSGGANSDRDGLAAEHRAYRPFGQISFNQQWGLTLPFESKGFIGERYDADAGLQFLNARYNDPELGTFIQPDWSEVTEAGVGTNRYSYSAIDPINKLDPNGNFWGAIAGWIAGALGVGQLFADIMLFFNVAQSVSAVARGASLGDVLKSWAVSYAIGVVSKAVGSLITIPPGGSDTPFHLESGAVGASTTSGPTAMVGGAADATLPGPVKFLYDTLYASDPNVTYFQHNQGRKLANWIRANKGKRITVIGHSRGGDTAARVVAKGNRISRLVTVDPVRRTVMPKLANVKKYSDVWINYDSKGTGLFGGGNFIATLGRPYNAAPEAFATRHYVKALDHVRICAVYCHP